MIWISSNGRAVRDAAGKTSYYEGTVEDITGRKEAEEALFTRTLQLSEAMDLARMTYWEGDENAEDFIFNDVFYALYRTTAEREGGYRMTRKEYSRRFVHPDDIVELSRQIKEQGPSPRRRGGAI